MAICTDSYRRNSKRTFWLWLLFKECNCLLSHGTFRLQLLTLFLGVYAAVS
jgi:hypothetical protein